MKLSALHNAVRALARGEQPDAETLSQLSKSERTALLGMIRRLEASGDGFKKLQVVAGSAEWLAPGKQTATV